MRAGLCALVLVGLACRPPPDGDLKTLRIAIVGAGASGLTAAETLDELGYQNVTVFEKNASAGGKVRSSRTDAGVAELGAVIATIDYKTVTGLADKYGIPYVPTGTEAKILDDEGDRYTYSEFFADRYGEDKQASAVLNYFAALTMFDRWIQADTNGWFPPDLALPFEEFADKYGFLPIADMTRSLLVGTGYGYYETAPALYMMKAITVGVDVGGPGWIQPADFYIFPTGYQSLWEAVAMHHDVRFNSEVTKITRRGPDAPNPITLTINDTSEFDFDVVIISAPLHRVGRFMELTAEESELFSQVESWRYVTSHFTPTGLPSQQAVFYHDNSFLERIDRLNAYNHVNTAPDVWVAWQLAQNQTSPTRLAELLAQDVALAGGTVEGPVLQEEWEYFPHVKEAALRDGFYERIWQMQGENNTYYVGSTLSFETVEHAARQAQGLVKRHFPSVR